MESANIEHLREYGEFYLGQEVIYLLSPEERVSILRIPKNMQSGIVLFAITTPRIYWRKMYPNLEVPSSVNVDMSDIRPARS